MATPSSHALLSASSSERWMNCTASPRFEAQFPLDGGNEYTRAGTLAHSICELYARKKFTPMSTRKFNADLRKLQADESYDAEMLETADFYVSYLYEKAMSYEEMPHVSLEVRVDLTDIIPDGFGTCDCVMIGGDLLHITDYKHGQGVVVDSECNSQMMCYAYGALKRYAPIYGESIKHVSMAIVQPRVTREVKEYKMSVDDLLAWGVNTVKPLAKLAYDGNGDFVPGDYCKFCRGKYKCPKRAGECTALEDFKDFILPDKAQNPLDPAVREMLGLPKVLTDQEIGDLLTRGKILLDWYESLQAYALKAILDGKMIPGYKVVEGKSNRAFRDADEAMKILLANGVEKESMYEIKPKTLAQLEKLVGAKHFAELVGELIFKPAGKPTLAVEGDARPNYNSAALDFSGVSVNE